MTAKEENKMRRLEIENRLLRNSIANHMRVYGDQLITIVDLRAKIELIESVLRSDE